MAQKRVGSIAYVSCAKVFLAAFVSGIYTTAKVLESDDQVSCADALQQLSLTGKLGTASSEEERKLGLAALDNAFRVLDNNELNCQPSSISESRRLDYARSLKRDGRYEDALKQLEQLLRMCVMPC